jgi:hypothetical protein
VPQAGAEGAGAGGVGPDGKKIPFYRGTKGTSWQQEFFYTAWQEEMKKNRNTDGPQTEKGPSTPEGGKKRPPRPRRASQQQKAKEEPKLPMLSTTDCAERLQKAVGDHHAQWDRFNADKSDQICYGDVPWIPGALPTCLPLFLHPIPPTDFPTDFSKHHVL